MTNNIQQMTEEAVGLLQQLIKTPSVSRDEKAVADLMEQQMKLWGLAPKRVGNNLMLIGKHAEGTYRHGETRQHMDTRSVYTNHRRRTPLRTGR